MKEFVLNEIGAIPDHLLNLAFLAERKSHDTSYQRYMSELSFYTQPQYLEGKNFLRVPDSAPEFDRQLARNYHGGEEVLFSYPSRYQPANPSVAPRLYSHVENRTGYLWLWRHKRSQGQEAPPLVLCVHGFRMGHPKRAMAMFKIRKLFEMGMDVALFIQPHHWLRASKPLQQYFFVSEDLPLTLENVGQQVHDLHSCYLGLKAMGYNRIGLIGGSLGGLAVTLYSTVSSDPEFIFSVVPAIRVDVHMDPKRSKLPFPVDEKLRQQSFRALDVIDPSTYSCKMDLDKFGVVYHKGDRINDARATESWIQKWGIKHCWALSGGHWVVFDNKARGKAWYGWLQQYGFSGEHSK